MVLDTPAEYYEYRPDCTRDVTMDDPGLASGANDVTWSKELEGCHAPGRCRPHSRAQRPKNQGIQILVLKNLRASWRRRYAEFATRLLRRSLGEGGKSVRQSGHRGTEVRFRRVPELHDQRMVFERLLDDAALNAFAASMNQPNFAKARFVRSRHVLDDNRCHIAWRERMKVEGVFDRDLFQDG